MTELEIAKEFEKPMRRPGKTQATLQEICKRFYELRKREEERAALQCFCMLRGHFLLDQNKPLGPCR